MTSPSSLYRLKFGSDGALFTREGRRPDGKTEFLSLESGSVYMALDDEEIVMLLEEVRGGVS